MIGEVSKALKTYEALDSQGKRLFREELGLVRPQQARKRAARKRSVVEPTQATPVRVRRLPLGAANDGLTHSESTPA